MPVKRWALLLLTGNPARAGPVPFGINSERWRGNSRLPINKSAVCKIWKRFDLSDNEQIGQGTHNAKTSCDRQRHEEGPAG